MTDETTRAANESAQQAAARLKTLTTLDRHDVAVILGSGWVPVTPVMRPIRESVERFKPKPGRESGEAVRVEAPTIYGVTMLVTSRWSDEACKASAPYDCIKSACSTRPSGEFMCAIIKNPMASMSSFLAI